MINEEEIDSPMKPKNRVEKKEELIDLIWYNSIIHTYY